MPIRYQLRMPVTRNKAATEALLEAGSLFATTGFPLASNEADRSRQHKNT
ncbi:hypothetical protein [Methylomicrobium sp. Wu6]|nr:hypothetical protein [Methylomicrobium sp. Wu6]MEC4748864.1 hypothetical protein [Methylomicrobium sp. Wu6]